MQAPPPRPRRRWLRVVGATIAVFLAVIVAFGLSRLGEELPPPAADRQPVRAATVAIFGATGRVGEGIFAAAVHDSAVKRVHVITRRSTPDIDRGVASGKVQATTHTDYLDYSAIAGVLDSVDVVYWAIGTSTLNVDDAEYSRIHVDFPKAFVTQWLARRGKQAALNFHYVSGQGSSPDAWFHWAREKARAERELTAMAGGTQLRVVSYRPAGVVPLETSEDFTTRFRVTSTIFLPTKISIEARSIGEAMLEVTARGDGTNGRILENRELLSLASGYRTLTPRAP